MQGQGWRQRDTRDQWRSAREDEDYGPDRGPERWGSDRGSERWEMEGPWRRGSFGGGLWGAGRFGGYGREGFGREGFGRGMSQQERPWMGRAPKGYVRSDERIREDVYELLSEGYIDAVEIEVQVRDGEVTLSGTVPDRRSKRTAEEMVDSVRGVKDVENKIKVKPETEQREMPATQSSKRTQPSP